MGPHDSKRSAPLPDLAVYMSYWRALLLLVFSLPFLLGTLGLLVAVVRVTSVQQFAERSIALGLCMVAAFLPVFWVLRYRRGRGPMYVFTANGLIVGRHFGGQVVPWLDVWISTPMLLRSGPIVVNVDYRKPEFRSDPNRRSVVFFDVNRRKTIRRVVMPNIATLRGENLQRTLIQYLRASGIELPGGI